MTYLGQEWDGHALDGLRTIIVPSGIGELQWAMAKYLNTGEPLAILGLDGAPRRLHQFCALHPTIHAFGYVGYDYSQIRAFQQDHALTTWQAVTDKFARGSAVMLACNPHLEAGRPLAEWLPDLPTTYRYPLVTTAGHRTTADRYLSTADPDDLLIGISCASYRGADAWKTWHAEEWTTFLQQIQAQYPQARFVLLGGSWDDLTAAIFDEDSDVRWLTDARGFPPVGRTEFGAAVEMLKRLQGYIGFSSGLGHVAAHCCDCPVAMFWPHHEQALSRAWVDPELLDTGFYVPSAWIPPADASRLFTPWLRRVADGAFARPTLAAQE